MAILNIGIDGTNMKPVNGQYRFTIDFIDKITGQLSTDEKFPQNQVYTTDTFVEPYYIPVEVADGNYTIGNIDLRVKYKDQTVVTGLFNRTINCNTNCSSLPITNIEVNGSTLTVTLNSSSVNNYNWKVLNSSNQVEASGVSNVINNTFNVTIPALNSGQYLFEVVGNNCVGKSIKSFNIATSSLPLCERQPSILSIISSTATSLQFQFDGMGVFGISWRIKQSGVTVRSGVIKHISVAQPGEATFSSATPTIYYSEIPTGNFSLEIEGETCRSETISTSPFSVVGVPLAFTNNSPTPTKTGSTYTLTTTINKTGTFNTILLNTDTGVYYQNGNVSFTANTPYIKTEIPSGKYILKIDTLEKSIVLAGESTGQSVYELSMNLTGYGFSPDDPHGMNPEWVERIESYNYDWGWGINSITILVPWNSFEPTIGNYRLDGVQKNIDYCNARGLILNYNFWALRHPSDGVIQQSEMQKAADGSLMLFGGQVSPSYGCDRTNRIIKQTAAKLAEKLQTYSKAGQIILAGGHNEELVNAPAGASNLYMTDVCDDNLARFNNWVSKRGITSAGYPPMVNGIGWPHPDWNSPLGLEWGRFLTYNIRKYFDNFLDGVKSTSNLPVLYYYAQTGGGQNRSTSNPNYNWIAERADGMYGTDGSGIYDHKSKFLVNAVNLGTFPDKISSVEFDAHDLSRHDPSTNLPYCDNNLDLNLFQQSALGLYQRGCKVIHFAMAFCPTEIRGMSAVIKELNQQYVGKPYVSPNVNSGNTRTINVVPEYRNGGNYLWQVDPYTEYCKIIDDGFFGGVTPWVETTGGNTGSELFEGFNIGGKSGEVWLPAGYSSTKKYAVIYALDGQTLYAKDNFPDGNWNFNNTTKQLMDAGEIKDVIVVSITSGDRMRDFLPNDPFNAMNSTDRNTISTNNGGGPLADAYLSWLITSLKPYIDGKYSTLTDKANTVILGASMGGLFAAYAYGKRPDIFGRLASVSTHYQGTLIGVNDNLLSDEVVSFINTSFVLGNKLYFDSGTESLDANYLVYQSQVKTLLENKGYNNTNLKVVVAQGAGHNPTFWGQRLAEILKFLIPRN